MNSIHEFTTRLIDEAATIGGVKPTIEIILNPRGSIFMQVAAMWTYNGQPICAVHRVKREDLQRVQDADTVIDDILDTFQAKADQMEGR